MSMKMGPNLKKFMNMLTKKELSDTRQRLKDSEEGIAIMGIDFANRESIGVESIGHFKNGKIVITDTKEVKYPYNERKNNERISK